MASRMMSRHRRRSMSRLPNDHTLRQWETPGAIVETIPEFRHFLLLQVHEPLEGTKFEGKRH